MASAKGKDYLNCAEPGIYKVKGRNCSEGYSTLEYSHNFLLARFYTRV
jgi:hypothetical protein